MKLLVARQSPSGKPVVSTECGYRYSGDQLVSEKAGATYLPRLLAEFFRRGFFRSFQYELLGSEWGLLRDDLTERPAFTALKNMLTVLHDADETAPGSPDFTLKDAPPDVRRVLLRKSGGAFYLLLWREVPSWDVQGKKDLTPKPAALTLEVAQPAAKVQTYSPNESTGPRTAGENNASIPLTVGDALLIVRIE